LSFETDALVSGHPSISRRCHACCAQRAWSNICAPELIAAAGPEVTETYIDFFTAHDPEPEYATSLRPRVLAVF
jgi:hypothetical protein